MIQDHLAPTPPRDFFQKLAFRGAVVTRIESDARSRRLTLGVDLLNYNQEGYDAENDPETSPGALVFEGAALIELDPEDALSPLPSGGDAEIIRLDADEERDGQPVVTLVLQRSDYATHEETTLVARLHAISASWKIG